MTDESTSRMRRRRYLRNLTIGGTAVIAGCTGGGDQTPTEGQSGETTTAPSDEDTDTEGGSEATPSEEALELISSIESPLDQLDPHTALLRADNIILKLICQQLFRVNNQGQVIPFLVENMETSSDNLTWTLELKEGVMFQPPVSREMTAEDVKFSIERIKDPDLGSVHASNLEGIDNVIAEDDHTARIEFNSPRAGQKAFLGYRGTYIIPEEAVDDIGEHPVGTGPFVFEEWVSKDHISLSKHEEYWEDGLPHFEEVRIRPIGESSVKVTEIQTGEVEMLRQVPADSFNEVKNTDGITAKTRVTGGWRELQLNASKESHEKRGEGAATGHVKVRQAIQEALDRPAFLEGMEGGFGRATYQPFPPSTPWHVDYEPYTFEANPEKAKSLYQEAGFNNPEVVLLIIQGIPVLERMGRIAEANLSNAGFDVKAEQLDAGTAINRSYDLGWDVLTNFGPFFPDPSMFRPFWHSEGSNNSVNYANDKVDRLLEELDATFDTAERKDIWDELWREHLDTGAWLFLTNPSKRMAWENSIKNFEISPTTTDWWIHRAHEEG